MLKHILSILNWGFIWLYYVCLICFFGSLAGVITHLGYALIFATQPDYGYFAAFGFTNGLKYGSVWAGGAAIVLSVMRGHKNYQARQFSGLKELES
jgi:hypothetical protein